MPAQGAASLAGAVTGRATHVAFAHAQNFGVYGQIIQLLVLTGQTQGPDPKSQQPEWLGEDTIHWPAGLHEIKPRARPTHRPPDTRNPKDLPHTFVVQQLDVDEHNRFLKISGLAHFTPARSSPKLRHDHGAVDPAARSRPYSGAHAGANLWRGRNLQCTQVRKRNAGSCARI